MDFVVTISRFLGRNYSTPPLGYYLTTLVLNYPSVSIGQTRTGLAVGTVRKVKFSSARSTPKRTTLLLQRHWFLLSVIRVTYALMAVLWLCFTSRAQCFET